MTERGIIPMVGQAYALPVAPQSLAQQQAKHAPNTIAFWGQKKRWPQDLVNAIYYNPAAGKTHSEISQRVFTEAEAVAIARDTHVNPGSVQHWGLIKQWPAWLVAAMATQKHGNEVLTEDEAHALAEQIAGLPLGRK